MNLGGIMGKRGLRRHSEEEDKNRKRVLHNAQPPGVTHEILDIKIHQNDYFCVQYTTFVVYEFIANQSRRAGRVSGRVKGDTEETDLVVIAHDRPLQLGCIDPGHEVFHTSTKRLAIGKLDGERRAG